MMSNLITKFNNGRGTVLCNLCNTMLVDGCNVLMQIDCAHVCDKCWQKVLSSLALDELVLQGQEWEIE